MKRIWKFPLDYIDRQIIEIPQASNILSVQMQRDAAILWAEVETDRPKVLVTIYTIGTGKPMPKEIDLCRYISTAQMAGGNEVYHFYESLTVDS